eukprot:1865338-Amphidinium_carterae.1
MAVSPCLMVERQIPNRSEGSENCISKTAPKIISTTSSPIRGVHLMEGSPQAEIQVRGQLG